jgi:hypothetical protein
VHNLIGLSLALVLMLVREGVRQLLNERH